MKKNIMLRLSAVLLVAVLLTTCVISGTWAKYTSAGAATDSATVAKWGVTVTVTGNEAFKDTYAADDALAVSANTVVSSKDPKVNVLAPGTSGDLGSAAITGTPEVAVKVVVKLTVNLTGWQIDVTDDAVDNAVFYCPLVISNGTNTVDGTAYEDDEAGFIAAIEALAKQTDGQEYAPNTNLATEAYGATLTWAWAFNGNDVKDTALGNLGDASSIAVEWDVTVDQVD